MAWSKLKTGSGKKYRNKIKTVQLSMTSSSSNQNCSADEDADSARPPKDLQDHQAHQQHMEQGFHAQVRFHDCGGSEQADNSLDFFFFR